MGSNSRSSMDFKSLVLIEEALPKLYERTAEPRLIALVKRELRLSGLFIASGLKPAGDYIWSSIKAEDLEAYFSFSDSSALGFTRPANNKVVRSTTP